MPKNEYNKVSNLLTRYFFQVPINLRIDLRIEFLIYTIHLEKIKHNILKRKYVCDVKYTEFF